MIPEEERMIDIDKLSALEKAVTPPPWYAWERGGRDEVPHSTDGGIFTISKDMCVKNWQKRDPLADPFPLSEEVVIDCTESFCMPHQYQTFEFIADVRNQLPELIIQFEKMREELRMYRLFPGPMNRHYYGIDPFAPRHIISLQLGTFYIKLLLDTLESNTSDWQWPELKRYLHYILTDYMIERENAMVDLSMVREKE